MLGVAWAEIDPIGKSAAFGTFSSIASAFAVIANTALGLHLSIWVLAWPLAQILIVGLFVFIGFFATLNLIITVTYRPERKDQPIAQIAVEPKVAVLAPVRDDPSIFNSVPFMERMDYRNFGVFVVDDSLDEPFKQRLATLKSARTEIITREQHTGRKAGAINYALEVLAKTFKPDYVVIFDADHRPTEDFLKKAVSSILETNADCVCGYQKHDLNATSIFRKAYQATHSCGIINFKSRNILGIPTIFGGGCGIFRFDWLLKFKFDATSITEDWELSCRGYIANDFKIVIREDLYAHAGIPKQFKWFITQQLRWSEGTISDFRKHFRGIMRAKHLGIKERIGLFYQGLYYFASIPLLVSYALSPMIRGTVPPVISEFLSMFFLLSWALTFSRGTLKEKFSPLDIFKTIIFSYFLAYAMTPVYAWSSLRGLVQRRASWTVTRRTG